MSTDSLPPDEYRSLRIRLEALTLAVQAMGALLLPLEGAVRELLGETPDVRVRLVAAPEEGAIAEVGMEWTISYRDLMSGWNPVG